MLYSIVAVLIIILDQAVKLAVNNMVLNTDSAVKTVIPGVLSIVRVQNDGAAFSFLAGGGARIWFIVLTLIFVALVIIALVTNFISGKFGRWCMVIVAAGGLSNCIDRVLYGYVLDMFRIDLFNFAVFNVADIFITVGCIAFIIYILFGGEKKVTPVDKFDEVDNEEEDTPVREPLFKKRKSYYEEEDDDDDDDDDEYDSNDRLTKKLNSGKVFGKKGASESINASDKKDTARPATPHIKMTETSVSSDSKKRKSAEDEAKAFEEFFKKRADAKQTAVKNTQQTTKVPIINEVTEEPAARPVRAHETVSKPEIRTEEPVSRPATRIEEPISRPAPITEETVTMPASRIEKQTIVEHLKAENQQNTSAGSDDFDLDSILDEFK